MKKILLSLSVMASLCLPAFADEGMWMLPLLKAYNAKAMKDAGCKLAPGDIYSADKTSLKDAVVIFGSGCTGEIISDEGLVITNHHCGYSAIQQLSTTEHNYLEDGWWAMNRGEEIPAPGLTVTFLQKITDVTDLVTKAVAEGAKQEDAIKNIEDGAKGDWPHCTVDVQSFYNDNSFYLIVYKTFRDIRFVGAPPASAGKFGGDTDNWMWPRHTCDFSMFRVYSDLEGNPAEYSDGNVPYRPVKSLKISLRGVREGDYAMIMGYPGRTQRFQTAVQLGNMLQVNRTRVDARTVRQDIMWKEMRANDTIGLWYANKYASSSNYWKKWQGMELAFNKLNIISKEEDKEREFAAWAGADAARNLKYGSSIEDIAAASDAAQPAMLGQALLVETLGKIEVVNVAGRFARALSAAEKAGKSEEEAFMAAYDAAGQLLDEYSEKVDRETATALIDHYCRNVAKGDEITLVGWDIPSMDAGTYTAALFGSAFTSKERMMQRIKSKDDLKADPAMKMFTSIKNKSVELGREAGKYSEKLAAANKAYTAGLLEWNAGKPSYPDANFTMRLTYGNVKGYSPKDGVDYRYYTTLDGVMEKEDPSNYEFRVPAKLKEVWQNKDYGRYADGNGQVRTCFLTNNDITGGNSGSPVLNAKGELIGLAFDGNWESMSSDVMFEPDLQRCICVDIRYVLLMMDKVGGAGYLINEMKIAE